ncbi:hypothetical protein F511_27376 [Dorcoceras hygrometricum]|uniref:Uncharacterized protein n=1 Tax=Dorcoceras hygrometricum TaxID=472368 RepID=A0A2Z7BD30_9LAMI|nr:hypothetical protein F511_27376 [Dorcoceras hygrometricum]
MGKQKVAVVEEATNWKETSSENQPAEYDEQGGSNQLKSRKEQNKSSSRAYEKGALNERIEEKSSDQISVMNK